MKTANPELYRLAQRLMRNAVNRAPSFVFFNICFENEVESFTKDQDEQFKIYDAARELRRWGKWETMTFEAKEIHNV